MKVDIPGVDLFFEIRGRKFTLSLSGFQVFILGIVLWLMLTIGIIVLLRYYSESKLTGCSSGTQMYQEGEKWGSCL